jgi:hypothetical protein
VYVPTACLFIYSFLVCLATLSVTEKDHEKSSGKISVLSNSSFWEINFDN